MDIPQVVVIAAVVVFVIVRRFVGQPLQARSMAVPLALTGWGVYQLRRDHLSALDVGFLALSALVGLVGGAARGGTIALYRRDGHLWQRYRLATLGAWVALILLRLGLSAAGHRAGVELSTGSTLLLTAGVSLLAESAVVAARAARTGVPDAPRRRRSAAGYR